MRRSASPPQCPSARRTVRNYLRLRRSAVVYTALVSLLAGIAFAVRAQPAPPAGDKQMLVQAAQMDYDYSNNLISAVGNVHIYYDGSVLEADKVVYDQRSKRLHAEGKVRLTQKDGNVIYASIMDLSDDYRDGFVDSLRLETPDKTWLAAPRAERTKGNFSVFHKGVYTACEPCKDDPKKPPLWQVKAARIIHDQKEKMIYFEDAQLEFFGYPIAWFPYFSNPDPTVKRKTGFLIPSISNSTIYGAAVEIPYYWTIAPSYDVTVAPKFTTRQGVLLQGEFRQQLDNGSYLIRGAGIRQSDPAYFGTSSSANRDWRGSVESSGKFAINKRWAWGWDALLLSDRFFLSDYHPSLSLAAYHQDPLAVLEEGVSQAYLTGAGNRSYFDARAMYFLGLSSLDRQSQIPVVHPVVDYNYTFDRPILGGELGYRINVTSISRQFADFSDSRGNACGWEEKTRRSCILRGVPGDYNRFSVNSEWRRTLTDSFGQVFTPFAIAHVDAANIRVANDPALNTFLAQGNTGLSQGDSDLVRAMPTVGVEYRYPFISTQSWGTQMIQPIAQVIVRPNEPQTGQWPNEDSQSFIFGADNLFRVNKFAGWDRVEGGGRVNYGAQYTAQFNQAGALNILFGQSYQLYGQNSFAVADPARTGLDSGLDTRVSDYVGKVEYKPNNIFLFGSSFRLDQASMAWQRLEFQGSAAFNRWGFGAVYGDYAAQPEIGYLERRRGLVGSASYQLSSNWGVSAAVRYDVETKKVAGTNFGISFIDDCVALALNYITGYTYSRTNGSDYVATPDQRIMMRLTLRTLGSTAVTQTVGTNSGVGTANPLNAGF